MSFSGRQKPSTERSTLNRNEISLDPLKTIACKRSAVLRRRHSLYAAWTHTPGILRQQRSPQLPHGETRKKSGDDPSTDRPRHVDCRARTPARDRLLSRKRREQHILLLLGVGPGARARKCFISASSALRPATSVRCVPPSPSPRL